MTNPDQPIEMIPISDLKLDTENPRLPKDLERDERSIIEYIANTTAIEELMSAISANGFFNGEPLIGYRKDGKGKCIIIEGNRRLTAAYLLNDSNLMPDHGAIVKIAKENNKKIKSLPVVVKNTREEVLPYLGFRHISGIKEWEPLAKARYIEQMLASTEGDPDQKYRKLARSIGSRRDFIKRNLDALAVYRVIEAHNYYNIEGLDEKHIRFAVLSTAVADERIGHFLGVSKLENGEYVPTYPHADPKNLKPAEIKEFSFWLYQKNKENKTRIGESRNLRMLSAVVSNTRALAAFRNGATLQIAYEQTSDVAADFLDHLYQAEISLREAASMMANINYSDEALETCRRILENIRIIGKTVNEKKAQENEFKF